MLRNAKLATLAALKRAGLLSGMAASRWRRQRLLILCYHGISLDDEHLWAPGLYIPPGLFEKRLRQLREAGCEVLELTTALKLLSAGELPRRSISITVDDGTYDFYAGGLPALARHRFPFTVYLTTYYCVNQMPVFRLICSYMLWKRRDAGRIQFRMAALNGSFDLGNESERNRAVSTLNRFALAEGLKGTEKHVLAGELSKELRIDYDQLCERRLLHVMNQAEAGELPGAGGSVEYHTHRHRTPAERGQFQRELADNGKIIRDLTGVTPRHFCYPSGVTRAEFQLWLKEFGVESATTCVPGLVRQDTPRMMLPRLLDHCGLSDIEFESWLCGAGALLPRRRHEFPDPEAD